MERVEGEKPRQKVLEAVRAIEMHMALSCIAMGILQSLSICFIGKVRSSQIRYQRTPSQGRVSGSHPYVLLSENIFSAFWRKTRIIHNANNSEATGKVRRTMGFSGFLVVQTFNCQDKYIGFEKKCK